jgi:hypothetical protein
MFVSGDVIIHRLELGSNSNSWTAGFINGRLINDGAVGTRLVDQTSFIIG